MKFILAAGAAFACLVLGGCGSLPRLPDGRSQILANLEGCDRHYEGIVQGVSFSGKVEVNCKAQPKSADAPPAPPAP